MGLRISERWITSDVTSHMAALSDGDWFMSWLPERPLGKPLAVTAMMLAEVVAEGTSRYEARSWACVEMWAPEFGLSADDAAKMALPPVVTS